MNTQFLRTIMLMALATMQLAASGVLDREGTFPKLAQGAWYFNALPRAVRHNGRTYFGWVDNAGSIEVASFADGGGVDQRTTLKSKLEIDDHDNPSLLVRDSDSKILAFYSEHNKTTGIWLRISSSAEDVSAFGSEANLKTAIGSTRSTYPTPIQLTGEVNDPIYLFYRDRDGAGNSLWPYSKSTDGGATWSAKTGVYVEDRAEFVADARNGVNTSAYVVFVRNGDSRIDFAVSLHPYWDNLRSFYIWHFYYEGGSYFHTDGTQITADLPLNGSEVTEVYDSSPDLCWIWDVKVDGSGNPVIAFAVFESTTDHRYYYARWNGSAWAVNEVVAGGGSISTGTNVGEEYYSGGIEIDPDNVNIVYVAREINGIHEIWKYTTADSGATWSGTAITSNSLKRNYRPVVPPGHGGGVDVLWLYGEHPDYFTYKSVIRSN